MLRFVSDESTLDKRRESEAMGGNDEAFHSDLQCCVRTVSYDFRTRCGRLDMEGGDCCDMTACIAFFRAIDPQVSKIETFSGEEPDTSYIKRSWGWQSVGDDGRVWPGPPPKKKP
jgi:hypothetical protein